jgi:hypothetical protein
VSWDLLVSSFHLHWLLSIVVLIRCIALVSKMA